LGAEGRGFESLRPDQQKLRSHAASKPKLA